ncbi:mitochondrial genome maintenance exonuclease 1-like [Trichogramma pretiosum]|uniref:mitochondrial genome maintenance exonuclease 1-like n=1 Tax=Trichogramma pretiosum TaxID=7493 RepID=UPI0006C97AA6|nr:mitochondrial genome maintenance exonuclease 1-like [Trichogramma pretiosum]
MFGFKSLLTETAAGRSKLSNLVRWKSGKSITLGGEKIRRKHAEEKSLFGKILETKKQKAKRLKLEKEGKVKPTKKAAEYDSEFAWVLSSSKNLRRLTFEDEQSNDGKNCDNLQAIDKGDLIDVSSIKKSLKKKLNDVHQVSDSVQDEPQIDDTVQDGLYDIHPAERDLSKNAEKTDDAQTQTRIIKTDNTQKNCLLPKEIVNRILQFPILDRSKNLDNQWKLGTEPLKISAFDDKASLKYPSVTRILSASMSEEAKAVLERWKSNMIEKLGLEKFEIYQKELLADGKLLHLAIMNKLTQVPYSVPDKIIPSFSSLEQVLKDISEVRAIESHVIHPRLMYRGIIDCIAFYRGELCVIDWKKSDKPKDTIGATYDAPLQIASYIGALNADINYPFQIQKGIIVVAYTSGAPAKVFEIDEDNLQLYWKLWLQRYQGYLRASEQT